jgi:hypothetical protein
VIRKKILFACGTEFHLLISYLLATTYYANDEVTVLLYPDPRLDRYRSRAVSLRNWKVQLLEGVIGSGLENSKVNAISDEFDVLHFFSFGYPFFNKLFAEFNNKDKSVILTDEGVFSYFIFRRFSAWEKHFDPEKNISAGFDPYQVKEIWLLAPDLYSDQPVPIIKQIGVIPFVEICKTNQDILQGFRILFPLRFPKKFNKKYIYLKQYLPLLELITDDFDRFEEDIVKTSVDNENLYIRRHPVDIANQKRDRLNGNDYSDIDSIPWEALLLHSMISTDLDFDNPELFISTGSSAMFNTCALGFTGKFVFTNKLLNTYFNDDDETISILIEKCRMLYPQNSFIEVSTLESLGNTLSQSNRENLSQDDFSEDELRWLRRQFLINWQTISNLKSVHNATVVEAQHYQNLIAANESLAISKEAEIDALNQSNLKLNGVLEKVSYEKANAELAVQKLEMELASEKDAGKLAVQKLEMELASEKDAGKLAVQKLEMELAGEKANAKLAVQKLEMELAAEKVNLTCSTQNLEQKSEEFHHQMAEKDEVHSRELQKMQTEQSQLEQDFNAQVSQYAELEQSLNFANHEITDYYNSTSWKITRPLRWISKKLRGSNV